MRYFDFGNRLTQDECALRTRDNENRSITDYRLYNPYNIDACEKKLKDLNDFIAENPNLRYRDGYGYAVPCLIDQDSMMRNDAQWTNTRERQSLNVRFFHAVPDISRGAFIPNTESLLKIGPVDSTHERQCDRLAEKNFNRFVPLQECVGSFLKAQADVTPQWTQQFGESSRETVRQKEFLESCGYVHDGKTWQQGKNGVPQAPKS